LFCCIGWTDLSETDEDEATAVQFIFESIQEGRSYTYIIKQLNRKWFRTRDRNPFETNFIHEMLKNKKYRGMYVYNRRPLRTQTDVLTAD
jgi:site-specific DNA recombinase